MSARAEGTDVEGADPASRTLDAPPRENGSPPAQRRLSRAPRALAVAGVIVGAGLVLGDRTITKVADAILPLRATVKSAGSFFPAFSDAYPYTSRALGWAILAAVAAGLAATSERVRALLRRGGERTGPLIALGLLVAGAFALYAWLSHPPNMYPSNARIHWVDIFFNRSERFFYVLVKPFHMLFYERPHVLQALNGAVNVALVYAIGARLFRSRWVPVAMAASFLASGLMLVFANPAEDVHLNVTFLLLVVLLYVRRSPFLGLGLLLVHLGRPPFAVFAVAFVFAELLFSAPEGERVTPRSMLRGALRNRYLRQQTALFAGLFVAWHAALMLFDLNWILANGRLIDAPHFDLEARDIDGFEISPLSMSYVLHMLWIFPAPILAANAVALLGIRRMAREDARAFAFVWLFVGMTLFVSEYLSQMYFNVRFLAYVFPLMLVTAWFAFKVPVRDASWRPALAGLAVLLAASTVATPTDAFGLVDRLEERPTTETFFARAELRATIGDRPVATTMSLSRRNYLAYVLKRPLAEIHEVEPGEAPPGAVVFTDEPDAYPAARVLWRKRALVLLDPS